MELNIIGLYCSAIDILISTSCIFLHGDSAFLPASLINDFSPFTSTLDLLSLTLVRVLLWNLSSIFAHIGWSRYSNHLATGLATSCTIFSLYSCCLLKILLLTEKGGQLEAIDFIFLVWSFVASLGLHVYCRKTQNAPLTAYTLVEEEGVLRKPLWDIFHRFLNYTILEWKVHSIAFIALFICSIIKALIPYYIGRVISDIAQSKQLSDLYDSLHILALLGIVSAIADGIRGGLFNIGFVKMTNQMRYDLYSSLLNQEVAFFDGTKTGVLLSRLTADTECMADNLSWTLGNFSNSFLILIGSLGFMLSLSWRLGVVTCIITPIIWITADICRSFYDINYELSLITETYSNDVAHEIISTMRTVRSFAGEDCESKRYYEKLTHTRDVLFKKGKIGIFYHFSEEFTTSLNMLAVIWYGGHLVLTGRMTPEVLLAFLMYQQQLSSSLATMGDIMNGLIKAVGASRKVFEYIDRVPKLTEKGTEKPSKFNGKIEFKNVTFAYPIRSDQMVLKNISFIVKPGKIVALVGSSGSGKSSCIALLEHFYEPIEGQILIDDIPIQEYDHHYIHQKIALVRQEPILFGRSITENIRYGAEDKTDTEIEKAAILANAHSFISDQTEQYKTNAGEKGSQLSGGQKQRIAIARALVRNPSILLLDEATSALDTESEYLVQDALFSNMEGRTVLFIAHRLSTVEHADRIIVIDKGQIVESGSHQKLLAANGVYAALVKRQQIKKYDEYSANNVESGRVSNMRK